MAELVKLHEMMCGDVLDKFFAGENQLASFACYGTGFLEYRVIAFWKIFR